jgi:hypothetical protein
MGIKWETSRVPKVLRVMMCGAAELGWFQASNEDRKNIILPRFSEVLKSWEDKLGARLIGTIDDDLFMVGPPGSPPWTWYLLYDVPDIDTIAAMIDAIRQSEDGKPRLDRFIRIEAIIGRPFVLLESSKQE